MSPEADAVLRKALALRDDDRENVAAALLASLDEPGRDDAETIRGLWAQELPARARRVLAGESPTKEWSDVHRRVARQLGR